MAMSPAEWALCPVMLLVGAWARPYFDRYVVPLLRDLVREF